MPLSPAELRASPCVDHDRLDPSTLEFCGIQIDYWAAMAKPSEEPPHMPLYLCNCPRCGSTLSPYVAALLYDASEPGR